MNELPYRMRAGMEVLEALDKASRGVQAASTELSDLIQRFAESHIDGDGQIIDGLGIRFDVAVKEEIASIYEEALEAEHRPPPADVRQAKAERAVRIKDPELWAEYHATKARIDALKLWISNQKATISANQSIRKGEAA